jgi:hypothetical protein
VSRIGLDNQVKDLAFPLRRLLADEFIQSFCTLFPRNRSPALRAPDEGIVDVVGCVPGSFAIYKLIIARLYGSAGGTSPAGLSTFPSRRKPDVPCGGFHGVVVILIE